MNVQLWKISDVKPYGRNPRRNDAAVAIVAKSIREFGFRQPIVVDAEGVIVCGHTRWRAARQLGLQEVPVHVATDLLPAQIKAYRLADNKTAEASEWDLELLPLELADLESMNFDLGLLGFSADELANIMHPGGIEGLTDPDEIPEPPDEPITQPGDLWILGNHRLLCGDSTKAEDVKVLLADAKPFLMVTDPPYGVDYDPKWRKQAGVNNSDRMGKVQNDDNADWTEAYRLFPGAVAYVWHGAKLTSTFAATLEAAEFNIRTQIIWRKQQFVLSRGHYHWQHEPCWYAVRPGQSAKWNGDRRQSTIWDIVNPLHSNEEVTVHGTQKPVECMARPIRNHGTKTDAVYEPFSGSGTTIVACEQLGRACYAMELDPVYIDVAVQRWQNFTGQKAERVIAEVAR